MSENHRVDQLNLDAAAARRNGMTYGKYMQWKSLHKDEAPKPIKRTAGEGEAVCKNCGKVFARNQHYRVFCSRLCRAEYGHTRDKAKKLRGGLGEFG